MCAYIVGTRLKIASVRINNAACLRGSIRQGIYLARSCSYLTIGSIERNNKNSLNNLAKSTKVFNIERKNFLRMYATETNKPFNNKKDVENNKGNKDSDKEKKSDSEKEIKVPKGFENFFNKNSRRLKQNIKEQASKSTAQNDNIKSEQQKQSSKQPPNVREFSMQLNANTLLPLLFSAYILYKITSGADNSREITWQEFRTAFLDKGLVDKLVVINRKKVRVYLHTNATGQMYPNAPSLQGMTYYFSIGSVEAFERKLDAAQKELGIPSTERIPVAYHDEISLVNTLLHFAPTLLLAGALFYITRRAGGAAGSQIFGIGKSKAKLFNQETEVKVKFRDVAGMDEAKEEIMEFVKFLKDPTAYERLGAKIPKGAILSGPPGTGKTLLAKATAGERENRSVWWK